MSLDSELIKQFVKSTKDDAKNQNGTTVHATTVLYNGKYYVKIDGSDLLTPINTTADVEDGERVSVLIKNHTATVTGNLSSPAARTDSVKEVSGKVDDVSTKITEVQILMADKVSTSDLEAINATIENLKTTTANIENLEAVNADIDNLQAKYASLEYVDANTVKALNADIENLQAKIGTFTEISTEDLNAINACINQLKAYNAEFTYVSAEVLEAIKANIKELEVKKLTAEEADIKYADIDFANIGEAAIENFYAKSGVIQDVVISDGKVTGTLVGVTIKGDLIEGGTIVADKLVIQGEDGLYYKLNTNGETVTSEQTEYNSLNGSIITAKSVTAEKVAVDDLVAFDATIGGFNITDSAIYSGVKESVDNSTRGIYLDKTGQMVIGDSNNYLKFFKNSDGKWQLAISADTMIMSSSGKTVETAISEAEAKTIVKSEEQYYQSTSPVSLIGGSWSTTQPTWTEGTYIWNRTAVTYGDGSSKYQPSSTGVCITGNTGAQGKKGDPGKDGTSVTILGSYDSEEELNAAHPTGTEGDSYIVNGDLYVWDAENSKWKNAGNIQGPQGLPGEDGEDGKTSYFHVAYANSADGKTDFSVSDSTDKSYIGQYTDYIQDDSTDPTKYSWTKIKGDKGDKGDTGTGYTILLSNESHTFPGSTSAAKVSSASTNIIAYINASQVSAKITSIGGTSVSGNASGISTGITGLTASVTDNSSTACTITFNATTSLTTKSGEINISIEVDGKTFTKYFSFSLSLTGATGAAGKVARAVDIVATSQVFKSTDGGQTFSPDTIKLTPAFQGGISFTKWQYSSTGGSSWADVSSGSNGLTVSNGVLTIDKNSSLYTDTKTSISFKCVSNDLNYYDIITVVKIYDVTDIEIGGTQLLKGTKDFSGAILTDDTVIEEETYNDFMVVTCDNSSATSDYKDFAKFIGIYPEELGATYTLSFYAKGTGDNKLTTYFCGDSGYLPCEKCIQSNGIIGTSGDGNSQWTLSDEWSRYWVTWNLADEGDISVQKIILFRLLYGGVASICGVKLEKGNKATDWSPSPDDIDNNLNEAIDNVNTSVEETNERVSEVETLIAKLEDTIAMLVTETVVYYQVDYNSETGEYTETDTVLDSVSGTPVEGAFTPNGKQVYSYDVETTTGEGEEAVTETTTVYYIISGGTSLMTQTSDGWTFNMQSIQSAVNDTSEGLNDLTNTVGTVEGTVESLQQAVDDLGKTSEYVKIVVYEDEPCIELGESDSDFKLLITNTRIMFREGPDTPTYINTSGLVTKNIEVEEEVRQGGFVWRIHGNGNLGLIWKGVDS